MFSETTTRTYLRLEQFHPLFTTALASASMFSNAEHSNGERNISALDFHLNNDTDSVLLLVNDEGYLSSYGYRRNSTVITCMICAWVLLIVSVTFCCFAQCGIKKRTQRIFHGRGNASEHRMGVVLCISTNREERFC
ncbi:PREDICTED: uncharacterized protein LOC108365582 [Rhagoletis zephyria]|uniref:uncharacterized protein LOC108365582 n=1 Tax=Rhagoletis zephyria TaxID=28612 RepID=UPI0008118114|nr:PREDICTED: uncharacterized protein LOC108365582 [Rhagoletis zephyria]